MTTQCRPTVKNVAIRVHRAEKHAKNFYGFYGDSIEEFYFWKQVESWNDAAGVGIAFL